MRTRNLLTLSFIILISSCGFDGVYLHPTKIPAQTRQITMKSAVDTTVVQFSGTNYQPTFLRNGKETLDFEYTIESVVFKSTSGNTLNGWLMKPRNTQPQVTLLHFHGNAGCLLSQYQSMTPLIRHGFQVFIFDYSGFGFSEGDATRKNVLADANAALTYLNTRNDIKNTKIVIYGQSLGGHLSAVVAAQRQAEIHALVIEGAFSSHRDIAAEHAGFFGRLIVSEKYSAKKSIREFRKPVLVIHSTEDEVIPFKFGQKLFAAANAPKMLFEIRKCHMCGPDYYAAEIAEKIHHMLQPDFDANTPSK